MSEITGQEGIEQEMTSVCDDKNLAPCTAPQFYFRDEETFEVRSPT